MTAIDLTVAVTAQAETIVAGPPIRSAEMAISAAETAGFRVERLIGLDKPSRECRDFFCQPAFSEWKIEEYQFGDPYLTRNALIERAAGRWIAFLDADDLFSENWLIAGAKLLADADRNKEKVIVHPEMNWVFDGSEAVFTKPSQDDSLFIPHYFYFGNYYDMMCLAPKRAHVEIPYVHRDLANGFGYGDWQWNIETMAVGWRHVMAKDTIIFKRRRDASVVLENVARRTILFDIEPMTIDRVSSLKTTSYRSSLHR